MKKLVFFLGVLLASSVWAADSKIAIVDVQKVLADAPQVSAVKTKLQNQFEPQNKEIAGMQKQLQTDIEKYTKDNAVMKDKEKKDLQDKITDEQKKLREKEVGFQQNLVNAQNQAMQGILKQIQDAAEAIAKKQQYDMIVVKGAVLYNNASLDITDQVITALKK